MSHPGRSISKHLTPAERDAETCGDSVTIDGVDTRLTVEMDSLDREVRVAVDIRERLAALEARRLA
jgi:hypothetical protein